MDKIIAWLNSDNNQGFPVIVRLIELIKKNGNRLDIHGPPLSVNEALELMEMSMFLLGMAHMINKVKDVEDMLMEKVIGKRVILVTEDETKKMGLRLR